FLDHDLDRSSEVELSLRELAFRRARRASEELLESPPYHPVAGHEVEAIHGQREAPVLPDVDERAVDLVDAAWLAVRREAHQLVLSGVHLEAAELRECRIEKAERVREAELLLDDELLAAAVAGGRGGPLAHAVHREHRRFVEGRRVERARGVAL